MNQPSAIRLVAASTLVFAGTWLIARSLATLLAMRPGPTGIAAFCAGWIALYPLARRNTAVPSWMHWARGAFVLGALWLFMLLAK